MRGGRITRKRAVGVKHEVMKKSPDLRMLDIGDSEFLPIRLAAGDVEDAGNLAGLRMEAWL